MDSHEPYNADPTRQNDIQSVSSRRLKKREVDRRCQREARERTRARIAHLEALVDNLRREDANGQVTALLKQLKTTEEERDTALKTLKNIQQVMNQRPLKRGRDQAQAAGIAIGNELVELAEVPKDTTPPLPNLEAMPVDASDPVSFMPISNSEPDGYDTRLCPEVVRGSGQHFTGQTLTPVRDVSKSRAAVVSETYNWVQPQLRCCCHAHLDRLPGQSAVWQGNFWHFISDVLDERFDWAEGTRPVDDVDSEDLAIRAIVEGWDAVARRAPLHPSWQMLRRIDEATFGPIAKTERLAMLRAMHLLIQYHTEPTAERYARLPPWYIYRPSQHIKHTYAMEYWAWPTFRQRFFLNPHAYCGNDFFFLYQKELQLLWPFEFRDCYTHDLETGLYKPSRLFDERINNIRCWTMGPNFFQLFPELSSDIAASVPQVPRLLSSATERRKRQLRRPVLIGKRKSPKQDADGLTHTAGYGHDEMQLRPRSPKSHNEQAYTCPAVHGGYGFQGLSLGTPFSPCYEWHQFPQFDSDYLALSSNSQEASAPLAMSDFSEANDLATLTETTLYRPANGSVYMDNFIFQ